MALGRRSLWAYLAVFVILTVGVVLVPVFLIRPFSPQTPQTVRIAYELRRLNPIVSVLGAGLSLLLSVSLVRSSRRPFPRVAALLLLLPALGAAWLARQNHFEWLFHPLPSPAYVRASEVQFVDDADMIIGVELAGDAVAYPVRQMAYHHVVNDQVGGVLVVSTY
jgi:hypothetical protein